MHRFILHLSNGQKCAIGIDGYPKVVDTLSTIRSWKREGYMPYFIVDDPVLRLYASAPVTGIVIDASAIIAIEVLS